MEKTINYVNLNNFFQKDKRSMYCIFRTLLLNPTWKIKIWDDTNKEVQDIINKIDNFDSMHWAKKYYVVLLNLQKKHSGVWAEGDMIFKLKENIDFSFSYLSSLIRNEYVDISLSTWNPNYINSDDSSIVELIDSKINFLLSKPDTFCMYDNVFPEKIYNRVAFLEKEAFFNLESEVDGFKKSGFGNISINTHLFEYYIHYAIGALLSESEYLFKNKEDLNIILHLLNVNDSEKYKIELFKQKVSYSDALDKKSKEYCENFIRIYNYLK